MHAQQNHLSLFFSLWRETDQGGESSEGFLLVGHSTSVVTLAAHPLGQQVLTAQTRHQGEKRWRCGGQNKLSNFIPFHTKYKLLVPSYVRAVCRFSGPKKEVLSLRAFFKYRPLWSPVSTNPRQLCKKKQKANAVHNDTVRSFRWAWGEVCRDLHPVSLCKDGPLHGLLVSADELWGDTSGPGQSPLQQTCTHPGGPT